MGGVLVVGTLMIDIVAPWIRGLEPGANYTASLESCYGGGGGNVAYHLASMGSSVALVSGLGDDPLGRAYRERLEALGIRLYLARGPRTGMLVAVAFDGGERSFIADPGANMLVTPGLVEQALGDYRPRVVVVHGYLLASPGARDAAVEAARLASGMGALVVFDPGYYNMGPSELEAARRILEHAGVVVPNEAEAMSLAGAGDPVEAARVLAREHGASVFLKMGARGAVLVERGRELQVPAPRVEVANTVGCGDAFTAVVAYGLAQGWNGGRVLEEATRRGALVAGCRCPQCG